MKHLFIPGPVDVDPEVAMAQTKPLLPHRSKDFEEIFHRCDNKLRKIFKTESRIFITPSTGTGLHEAGVRNLVNKKMVSCINGAFGKRWHDVGVTNGKEVDSIETEWDQPITPDLVADAIKGKGYEILTIIHNETSTGLMNPVMEVAAVVKEVSPETLVCVDAVSSLSGVNIEMDAWQIDMLLTSSQKCIALPPGLAFAGVNEAAMERATSVENRGFYFDFLRLEKHRVANSTPTTAPVSLIYALDMQTDRILEEGLDARYARHSAMAKRTQDWAVDKGQKLYAPEGYRSQTVTAIKNSLEISVPDLQAYLTEKGMRISNGYGTLKNLSYRIGHMGEIHMEDLEILLSAMDEFFRK
ncbi:MAG: alanine--glyoxylate aminotransferase family protein [Anaerolineales bacterium]|nr:alanine--glyoxylate aminotransferase family protein [Anaerolineales bacterium]